MTLEVTDRQKLVLVLGVAERGGGLSMIIVHFAQRIVYKVYPIDYETLENKTVQTRVSQTGGFGKMSKTNRYIAVKSAS